MEYFIISFIVLLISYYLFKKVSGSLKLTQLNMISWIFYFNLIGQMFISSVLIVNGLDDHYVINKIANQDSLLYGYLTIQYSMIMIPLGMLTVVYLFRYKYNTNIFQKYVHSEIKPLLSIKDSYIRYPLYVLSLICILSVLYVLTKLDTIPIAAIIQGAGAEALGLIRQENSRGFQGNVYIRNIFALGLTPIVSYIAFAYYKMTKSKFDMVWFLSLAIATCLILTYNIAKSPLIFYLFGFLFLNILINGSVKKSTFYSFIGIILFLLIIIYIVISEVTDPASFFDIDSGILGRVLFSQAAGLYSIFDIFPKQVDFLGFSSMSSLINDIFNLQDSERSARIVMQYMFPSKVNAGTAGVMNSLFVAEAWANFGLVGLLIAPFYVGMFLQAIFMFFITSKKTPLLLGIFAFLSYRTPIVGGFNEFIYNITLIVLLIVFGGIVIGSLMLKDIYKNRKVTKLKIVSEENTI